MNKQEMIKQLNDRVRYNEEQRAYYEKMRDENAIRAGELMVADFRKLIEELS